MAKNYCILLLSFLCSITHLNAQDYNFDIQSITIEDGLLHRDVQTVFEDKNGFIWIGGTKGLQRYDGHNFKTWTKASRTGLVYYIASIGQDDAGWLWLWNNDLLEFVFLHPDTEEILTVKERFGDDFPLQRRNHKNEKWQNSNSRLPTNSSGQLFFMTTSGKLITFDSQNGFQIQKIKNIEPYKFSKINHIDKNENLWIQDANGVHQINQKGKILSTLPLSEGFQVGGITSWGKKIFLNISYENSSISNSIEFENGVFKKLSFSANSFMINGNLWQLNKAGHHIFEADGTTLIQTLNKENHPVSLFGQFNFPFTDSKGRIWIYGGLGLNKIELQPNRFKKYFSFDKENEKPFTNATRGIWVDEENVYINFEQYKTIRVNLKNPKEWKPITHQNWCRPLLKKGNDEFWIGLPFSILAVDSEGKLINEFHHKKGHEFSGTWSFFEDKNERLWIGAGEDLAYKDKDVDSIQIYRPTNDSFGFTSRRGAIQNMIPTKDGKVWFCSWTGLYLFDPIEEKILARYASDEEDEYHLPASLFYYLYEDKNGIYWLGTDNGLIRWKGPESYDNKTSTFRLFTRSDGFSNDVIYAIFEDNHNRLWLSTDYGIISFHKETFDVQAYLPKDGISHHEFNRTSQFQTEDGTIYFGGLNGVTSFHPDDFITQEKDYPKMLISDYEIFDGEEKKLINKVGELRTSNSIIFYPNDRFFRLSFVLPTFEDKTQILYAWKVEGVDEDWNYQKENSIQIGILPYGNHVLKIKGQSGGGGWSPHELAIQVHVLKPFYLQNWFLGLSLFSILAGIFAYAQWRTHRYKVQQKLLESEVKKATAQIQQDKQIIEQQANELKQLDKVKSRFFANVSHELRTPLTLMLGPISSVLKENNISNKGFTLLKTAQQNGKDLLKLIGSILDLSKMEAGKLALDEQPELLFPLVRRIISNFESHAQQSDIQFTFEYKIQKGLQFEIDKNKLEIVLNNLLSNAVKFTQGGGKVIFRAEDFENVLQFSVLDTGRGIHPQDLPHVFDRFYQSLQPDAPTEGGTGIGLAVSQEFIKMMDGKIWVESEYSQGSTFYVQIPRKEVMGQVADDKFASIEQTDKIEKSNTIVTNGSIPEPNSQHSTILIVEDNYSLRNYLHTILSPHFNILLAENGQVALDILSKKLTIEKSQSNLPDLILSDIMMPVMDGYQLLKVLRSKDYFRPIPVVMLTARADIQDRLTALRIGVDDYLLKPFEEEELLARIKNLLKNYAERISFQIQDEKVVEVVEAVSPISEEKVISQNDQEWLEQLEKTIIEHISDTRFNMNFLGDKMFISRRQLQRKIKKIVGLTPKEYINEIRLYEARQLLETGKTKSVKATAYEVGFADPQYFSIQFKERFGKVPSAYLE